MSDPRACACFSAAVCSVSPPFFLVLFSVCGIALLVLWCVLIWLCVLVTYACLCGLCCRPLLSLRSLSHRSSYGHPLSSTSFDLSPSRACHVLPHGPSLSLNLLIILEPWSVPPQPHSLLAVLEHSLLCYLSFGALLSVSSRSSAVSSVTTPSSGSAFSLFLVFFLVLSFARFLDIPLMCSL